MAVQFKFVELSIVTDVNIEDTVNEWVGQGWHLEGIRFVTTEHSKRPGMAFVSFTREVAQAIADREPPRRPPPLVKPDPTPGPQGQPPHIVKDEGGAAVLVAEHGTDVD